MPAMGTSSALPRRAPVLRHPLLLLGALCAMALMNTMGMAMPYPILAPIFVGAPADAFNHFAGLPPEWLMGVALAVNPLGILLGSLVLGPLSDRLGRRRVLVWSVVASALGHLLTAWALYERCYGLFVLARLATGLPEGNTAVARALLADLHPQIDRVRGFAWLNACLYSGWLIGPLIGGWTLPLGAPVPFVLAALMMLPCWAVLVAGLPSDRPSTPPQGNLRDALGTRQTLGLLRSDPQVARLFWLYLAYTAGLTALYEFEPLWMLTEAGLDSRGIASTTALQCAVMTGTSLLAGRWLHPARPLAFAARAALLAASGLWALAQLPQHWGLGVMIIMGAPLALFSAVLPAWVSERFAAHGQGRIMGLLSTTFCLANVGVALLGGVLALLQVRWIMALGGLACAGSAWALLRWARTLEREAP
jgi:MFS transporter, DHA1 family, tetracycline resistance protein